MLFGYGKDFFPITHQGGFHHALSDSPPDRLYDGGGISSGYNQTPAFAFGLFDYSIQSRFFSGHR
jgi:hypothetical protein